MIDGRREITERRAFRWTEEERFRHVQNQMTFSGLRFHRPRDQDLIATGRNNLDNEDRSAVCVAETEAAIRNSFGNRLDKDKILVTFQVSEEEATVIGKVPSLLEHNGTPRVNPVEEPVIKRSFDLLPKVGVIFMRNGRQFPW